MTERVRAAGPCWTLSDTQFDAIEFRCHGVHFASDQRRQVNATLCFWTEELRPRRRSLGPVAPPPPGYRARRSNRRQRRLWLVRELALHYEIAGGRPTHNGWNRSSGRLTGFAYFLEAVYTVLPPSIRPPTVASFVRDAEHLGFNDNPLLDQRAGNPDRARYLLRQRTAWWRSE